MILECLWILHWLTCKVRPRWHCRKVILMLNQSQWILHVTLRVVRTTGTTNSPHSEQRRVSASCITPPHQRWTPHLPPQPQENFFEMFERFRFRISMQHYYSRLSSRARNADKNFKTFVWLNLKNAVFHQQVVVNGTRLIYQNKPKTWLWEWRHWCIPVKLVNWELVGLLRLLRQK